MTLDTLDPNDGLKKVKTVTKHIPTGPTTVPQVSTALDALATQLQAEIQAIKNEKPARTYHHEPHDCQHDFSL